jgi:hypothetical protein
MNIKKLKCVTRSFCFSVFAKFQCIKCWRDCCFVYFVTRLELIYTILIFITCCSAAEGEKMRGWAQDYTCTVWSLCRDFATATWFIGCAPGEGFSRSDRIWRRLEANEYVCGKISSMKRDNAQLIKVNINDQIRHRQKWARHLNTIWQRPIATARCKPYWFSSCIAPSNRYFENWKTKHLGISSIVHLYTVIWFGWRCIRHSLNLYLAIILSCCVTVGAKRQKHLEPHNLCPRCPPKRNFPNWRRKGYISHPLNPH